MISAAEAKLRKAKYSSLYEVHWGNRNSAQHPNRWICFDSPTASADRSVILLMACSSQIILPRLRPPKYHFSCQRPMSRRVAILPPLDSNRTPT
jgi:hypothetical protein